MRYLMKSELSTESIENLHSSMIKGLSFPYISIICTRQTDDQTTVISIPCNSSFVAQVFKDHFSKTYLMITTPHTYISAGFNAIVYRFFEVTNYKTILKTLRKSSRSRKMGLDRLNLSKMHLNFHPT